jgi:LPS-assembly lipoprotein
MSWSRAVLLAGLLALAGCGYHPLYGPVGDAPNAPNVQAQLEAIHIVPSADRTGQIFYNSLRDRLNPRGVPSKARYDLTVNLREEQLELLLQQDETASRSNITIYADYVLKVAGRNQVLLQGTARSRTAYNVLNSEYATRTAAGDARARSATDLAESIRERLGIYFSEALAAASTAK